MRDALGGPALQRVLAVVAHPDDESFGLGGVLAAIVGEDIEVHLTCLTAGEASTIGASDDLGTRRAGELRAAAEDLGLASVELADFADGSLSDVPMEIQAVVERAVETVRPDALLVFEPGGVTGHPDHRAATAAAEIVADRHGLPCLEWGVPKEVTTALLEHLGVALNPLDEDGETLVLAVDRARQWEAINRHLSQNPNNPLLRERLSLEGAVEHLRIRRPERA